MQWRMYLRVIYLLYKEMIDMVRFETGGKFYDEDKIISVIRDIFEKTIDEEKILEKLKCYW